MNGSPRLLLPYFQEKISQVVLSVSASVPLCGINPDRVMLIFSTSSVPTGAGVWPSSVTDNLAGFFFSSSTMTLTFPFSQYGSLINRAWYGGKGMGTINVLEVMYSPYVEQTD